MQVIGYVFCSNTGMNVHIVKIAVSSDFRRFGIGRALMKVSSSSVAGLRNWLQEPQSQQHAQIAGISYENSPPGLSAIDACSTHTCELQHCCHC